MFNWIPPKDDYQSSGHKMFYKMFKTIIPYFSDFLPT